MKVTSVRALSPSRLFCSFDNGNGGVIDLGTFLDFDDARIAALADPIFFAQVIAYRGRILWPNSFSLCPHFLSSRLQPTPVTMV